MSSNFTLNNSNIVITQNSAITRRPDGTPLQINDAWIDTNALQIKKWNGLSWSGNDSASVTVFGNSAAVTLSASAKLPFNTKTIDTFNQWNTTTNEFTCVEPGRYLITVHVYANAGSDMSGVGNRPAFWYGSTEGPVIHIENQNTIGFFTTVASFIVGENFSIRMASTLIGSKSVDMTDSVLTMDRLF
jgi:hypothetical protein